MREPEREPPEADTERPQSGGPGEDSVASQPLSAEDADDIVTEASLESFPASDPPPWTSSATRSA